MIITQKFTETVKHNSVSESAPLGSQLPIAVAEDNDIGNYRIQSYEIVSRNDGGIFKLKISRPTSQLTKVNLVLSKRLDREKNHSFYLMVAAKDGGNPPRVGQKALNITVLDSNDHIPKFNKDLYVGDVRENSQAGTFVFQVSATNGDIGTNAEIVYSLKAQPQHVNLFSLDASTGELRTNTVLDYELPEAFDHQGKIPEDTPFNTSIAFVTVRDKDSESRENCA